MSVKAQQFQQTKQTILKNKQQFIQIQLKQINKRIGCLKNQNNGLKGQIKQLKNKPTNINGRSSRKISACLNKNKNGSTNGNSSFIGNRELASNKENLCGNRHSNEHGQSKDFSLLNQTYVQQQLNQYQQSLVQQQQTKQKQLKNLQKYIETLKKIWQQKQSISTNRKLQQMPSKTMSTSFNRSLTEIGKQREKQKQKGKEISYNIETFRNKNVMPKNDQIMTMQTMRQREAGRNCQTSGLNCLSFINMAQQSASFIDNSYSNIQQPSTQIRRKTMSLSLNNSMSQTPGFSNGFNFGKKMQTKNPKQFPNVSMQIHPNPHLNQLNNSTKTSMLSHTQSSKQLQLNRSAMKMSRSYAKIVTKLHCCGCNNQYRPNQYYNHIKECRPYIKIRLMEERECIHRQICGGVASGDIS